MQCKDKISVVDHIRQRVNVNWQEIRNSNPMPVTYNTDCFIITLGKEQRLIDLGNPIREKFPYDLVVPFSDEENQRFLDTLTDCPTKVQGYWYKNFDGTYMGAVIFFNGCPHFKYEFLLDIHVKKPVTKIIPMKKIPFPNDNLTDLWNIIYMDNSRDILLKKGIKTTLLDTETFM